MNRRTHRKLSKLAIRRRQNPHFRPSHREGKVEPMGWGTLALLLAGVAVVILGSHLLAEALML